jgi:hypothetical protein
VSYADGKIPSVKLLNLVVVLLVKKTNVTSSKHAFSSRGKKTNKPRKPKKTPKKLNHEKKLIKPIRIFKKIFGSVQFRFHKLEIKKPQLN